MDISFLPQMGGFALTIIAFLLALGVIVSIHEYGHYIVGRWSGIHADVFSLGFGPVLASRYDKRGTKWQLAAFPLGGFVKFKGDANAASGKDEDAFVELSPKERRHTMHGAPLWARAATAAAGPVFNFILSILVFASVMMFQGQIKDPPSIGQMRDLPGAAFTVQTGDEVIEINGLPYPSADAVGGFDAMISSLPRERVLDYTVKRDGDIITAKGPYPLPGVVLQVAPRSAAYAAGLRPDDVIVGANENQIVAFDDLKQIIEGSNGASVDLTVWRAGEEVSLTLTPKRVDEPQPEGGFKTQWRIGVVGGLAFELETITQGPITALVNGAWQTWAVITGSLSGLYHMVTGAISSCNMSGPIGIAEVSGAMASQGTISFIWFIAVLSTAVGLLNLFPIPILDGGHLMFYAYEAVTGRPPSDAALRILMSIGLFVVMSLMLFALFNDIFCP